MTTRKKGAKSKFMSEELNNIFNESQFSSDLSKSKKVSKPRASIDIDLDDLSEIKSTVSEKKSKVNESFDICGSSRQKILNLMGKQLEVRKQIDESLFKNLSELIANFEGDYDILKDNEQKLEQLTGCYIKCMQQANAAHRDKLIAFKDVQTTFNKEAEGLLLRGATKPDDRPLWFDVYKAFPPTTEPKFARPKPENVPIKQILYKEDVIRAKFHAKGHGLSVNMLSISGETQIKKLVQSYQQLQPEGLAEEDLIQKSVETVVNIRQSDTSRDLQKNPESVSSKIFSEADLKNIFKE